MRTLTAVAVVFLAACGPQLPIQVHIDDSWSPVEEQTILSAMEEWNVKAGQAQKFPGHVFVYQGRRAEQYGEHFAREDGRSVIYRALEMPDIRGSMKSDYGIYVEIGGDIILNVGMIWPWASVREKDGILRDYPEPYSFSPDSDDWFKGIMWERYRDRLKSTTLHELGHLAGIGHLDGRRPGIMNDGFFDLPNELQPADIAAFCQLHGC